MTRKEKILAMIAKLPDDVSFDRVIEKLDTMQAIEIGIEQIENGQFITHEELEKELRAKGWLDESDSSDQPEPRTHNKFDCAATYHRLIIRADYPNTEIWLGDDHGFFVQKETGTLDTSLVPGDYLVEFGLGTTAYPIRLTNDSTFLQAELAKGPTCIPPVPDLSDDSE